MSGRIPQYFIDDLLDRVDLVEVVDSRVPLRKTGRNFSACCPFHDDKTPSFSVNPDKQFFYCFGCGTGGNAISFLMDYERIDFPEAVEALAAMAGLEVPKDQSEASTEYLQKNTVYELLRRAADFYQNQLWKYQQAREAIDYLKARGLSSEIVKHFQIGFAPPGWDNLLTALGTDNESRQLLEDCGLVMRKDKDKLYDHFRHRIMFPIRDNRGRIIAFGGRVLGNEKPKYLNSPEYQLFHKGRELYGLYEARKANPHLSRLLIVEGYMDVVALAEHGITWVCATLGTATTQQHLEKIFRHTAEVVFCFDGDDAGRKAARRALEIALAVMQDGRQARFLFLPEGEDPDTLIRKMDTSSFIALIDKAIPLSEYLFDSLTSGLELTTLEGRSRLSNLAIPFLKKLPNGVFKQLMVATLSERTGADRAVLGEIIRSSAQSDYRQTASQKFGANPHVDSLTDLQKYKSNALSRDSRPPANSFARELATANSSSPKAIDRAITLLILQPRLGLLTQQLPNTGSESSSALMLLIELIELAKKNPDINTSKLLGRYHNSPNGEYLKRLLSTETLVANKIGQQQEFLDIMLYLAHKTAKAQRLEILRNLETIGWANMSPEEKEQYRQLVAHTRLT